MKKLLSLLGGALVALALPSMASAGNGYAVGSVNMRSGPGTQFTVITTVHAGAPVIINGCSAGWCDVVWGGVRGWCSDNYVTYGSYSAPVYVQPAPVYVAPPVYYRSAPSVSFGFGFYDDDRYDRRYVRRYRDRDAEYEYRGDRRRVRRDR
jgi:uncharacterized protein YraI